MADGPNIPPLASLYVGDLDESVSDGDLIDAFSGVGNVVSVRVCRDQVSRRSLGFGYVNFLSTQDATKAIEKLNHTTLNGKPIRVMWSHRDPDARKSGIGNVFVKNLHEEIDSMKLQDLFSGYGTITSCKVAVSSDGKSKGFGFVQFDSEQSVKSAIESLNGTTVEGKEIYVGNFIKKSDRVVLNPDAKFTNLYMKNFDSDVTEELLTEKFSKFGKIANLVISKDGHGISRGFGFVNYENPEDAKKAIEEMNGAQLGSKELYVARAQKKAERSQVLLRQFEEKRNERMQKYKGSNLYVKNIDDGVSDDELGERFSQFGTIISAKLMRDEKGNKMGFGFVCFSTPDEANKAVNGLHGFMLHGKPLYVTVAQRKEDRRALLQIQHAQIMTGLPGSPTALLPTGYPPLFYGGPPGVVPHLPPRQGLMYQPLGMRPGWTNGSFPPPTRPYQSMPFPMMPSAPRQHRQNRGRMNGQTFPQGNKPLLPAGQTTNSSKDGASYQRRGGQMKYVPHGRSQTNNNGRNDSSQLPEGGAAIQGRELEMLTSMLAAATPQEQKQILGEHLFPLVEKLKFDLASKITGMLLEMDNSELLLLLESPEALAAKVEEAVQVLNLSKANKVESSGGAGNQDNGLQNSTKFLPAGVAVN